MRTGLQFGGRLCAVSWAQLGTFCGRQTHINSVDPPFSNETSAYSPFLWVCYLRLLLILSEPIPADVRRRRGTFIQEDNQTKQENKERNVKLTYTHTRGKSKHKGKSPQLKSQPPINKLCFPLMDTPLIDCFHMNSSVCSTSYVSMERGIIIVTYVHRSLCCIGSINHIKAGLWLFIALKA